MASLIQALKLPAQSRFVLAALLEGYPVSAVWGLSQGIKDAPREVRRLRKAGYKIEKRARRGSLTTYHLAGLV